jgi:DNA-binding LacI/PurR family transcriptional regulator
VIDVRARNLRLQRTGTISVVFPLLHEVDQWISDPFFLEMLGHLADELSDRRYDLLLHKIGPGASRGLKEFLNERRTDGVVLIGQSTQHGLINELAAEFLPLVVWGAALPDARYLTVGSDNFAGARAAVRHLLGLGHKRIAFFGDPGLPEVAQRYAGYVAALAEDGMAPDAGLECRVPFDKGQARAAMAAFLERRSGFDAVFAASDLVAIAAIRVLDQRGLRVPGDVAVVGFDDIMLAGAYTPALTTVRQDIGAGARVLVDTLFARMNDEAVGSTVLPVELIVRASCGAVRPEYLG